MKELTMNKNTVEVDTTYLTKEEEVILTEVLKRVKPFYKKNDDAHQIDHGISVLNNLLYINSIVKETHNTTLLIVAALYHDIFANVKDRKNHHILASEYVLKDKYLQTILPLENIMIVSIMIREHRASFKGKRDGVLSDMLSVADIGKPNLKNMLIRSLKYHKGKQDGVVEHMVEKFGYDGYVNYPELYTQIYGDNLDMMKEDIRKLEIGELTIDGIING